MRDFRTQPILADAPVHAPLERVFRLSCRVELVKETLGMNLVGGVTNGFVEGGSRVVWRGWKFGLPTEHHTLITGYAAPHREADGALTAWFQDSQEKGRFAFFQHDHHFRLTLDPATQQPVTTLHDEVRFTLPFGFIGELAAKFLLAPHIERLCAKRFARIKSLCEGDGWREWLAE